MPDIDWNAAFGSPTQLGNGWSSWMPAGWSTITNPDSLQYVGQNNGNYSENPDDPNYHMYAGLLNAMASGQPPTSGWLEAQGPNGDSAQQFLNPDGSTQNFAVHGNDDSAFWNAALAAATVTGANMGAFSGLGGVSGAAAGAEGAGGGASALDALMASGGADSGMGWLSGLTPGGGTAAAGAGGSSFNLGNLFGGGGGGGIGGSGIGIGGALQGLSSIYGIYQGNKMLDLAKGADPFRNYRDGFAQQLAALMADPSSVTKLPGYAANMKASEQALTRNLASQGLTGSGTAAEALTKFGAEYQGNAFNTYLSQLAGLAGAGSTGAGGAGQMTAGGYNTINNSLNNLAKIFPRIGG